MNMGEKKTIVKYIATILVGDEYHSKGEEHEIGLWANEVEKVKERGMRIQITEKGREDLFHFYPVSIRKETYELQLVDAENIEGGYNKGRITHDIFKHDDHNDWMDRWP